MSFAGEAQSGVEFVKVFHLAFSSNSDADEELTRTSVHGIYVTEVHHCRFVAEMFERRVGEVEVNALHQHVRGRHDAVFCVRSIVHHSTIISHSEKSGGIERRKSFGESVNQSELTQSGDFRHFRFGKILSYLL